MIDYDYEERLVTRIDLRAAIARRLTPRQRDILTARLAGSGESYRDSARRFGVSVERVRQIYNSAVWRLQDPRAGLTVLERPFDRDEFNRHMHGLIVARDLAARQRANQEAADLARQEQARRAAEQADFERERKFLREHIQMERGMALDLAAVKAPAKAPPPKALPFPLPACTAVWVLERIKLWGEGFGHIIDLSDLLPGGAQGEVCVMRHTACVPFSFPDGSAAILPPGRFLMPYSDVVGRKLPVGVSIEQIGRPSQPIHSSTPG